MISAGEWVLASVYASFSAWPACLVGIILISNFFETFSKSIFIIFNPASTGESKALAQKLQDALIKATKMRDRKAKQRTDLAVLKFNGIAVLVELGFIANDQDRAKLLNAQMRDTITRTIARVMVDHLAQV